MMPLSPGETWLLLAGIVVVAWLLVRLLVLVDEWASLAIAHLWRRWQYWRLQQRQNELARTRKSRVRALTQRGSRASAG